MNVTTREPAEARFSIPEPGEPQIPALADPGRRLAARAIDIAAVAVLYPLAVSAGFLITDQLLPGAVKDTARVIAIVVAVTCPITYEAILLGTVGATIGKKLLRLRVLRRHDGLPAGWIAVTLRPMAFWVFVFLPFGLLNPLWCLWDKPHRQTLHDKIVRTVVVTLPKG
ncbi:RDD family protein [Phytomonospora sp. NPDC050363]|uniref:RDD family protein n=1 Tax=Phytomonospora sp. NPDC050363 TaxID=3155642 RepID=UPI00340572B2